MSPISSRNRVPPSACSNRPRRMGLGAGKGAAFVAKQLRLHQLARDSGHIESDEGVLGPRAVPVQGPRHQLLAGARLAVDQHRDVGSRQPPDGAEHLLHGRRFEPMISGGVAAVVAGSRHVVLPVVGEGPGDEGDRLIDVERLRQVFEGTALVGGHGAVEIRVAGHDDDREMRAAGRDLAEQLQAVGVGHANVADDRVGLAPLKPRAHPGGALEPFHREPRAAEGAFEHPPDGLVIVDDPDLALAAHGCLAPCPVSIGSRMLNVVSPGRLVHSMIPPCSWTSDCAIDSPSPVPPSRPDTSG